MTPWWLVAPLALGAFAEDDEEEETRRKLLGLGGRKASSRPEGRTGMQLWGVVKVEPLYVVSLGDGYAMSAHENDDEAIDAAKSLRDQDSEIEELVVTKYERVPQDLYDLAIKASGERGGIGQEFSDGYGLSHELRPYLSKEKKNEWSEQGVVWDWQLRRDEHFRDWPEGKKKETRQELFDRCRPAGPLPEGLRFTFRTDDPEPFLEDLELVEQGEDRTALDEALWGRVLQVGPSGELEGIPTGEGPSVVTVAFDRQVEKKYVAVVPWADPEPEGREFRGTENQNKQMMIDEFSEVLGGNCDPKKGGDAYELLGHYELLAMVEELEIVLVIETSATGDAVVFVHPDHPNVVLSVVEVV